MRTTVSRRLIVAAIAMLAASNAAVAAQRTFVATTGSDAHACSLVQPCRGFATALVHTDPGGEIVVLDSGGYGRVTISQSVTISAPPGVHAGISVFPGTNGVDIPAGGVKVVLRGLAISGQGGTDGIYVSGDNQLTIERCDVGGVTGNGIHLDGVAGTVQIRDTVVHDNGGNGIMLFGALSASLDRVQVERNTLTGLFAIDGPQVRIKEARLMRNNRGLEAMTTGVTTGVVGDGISVDSSNHHGVRALASGGGVLFVTLARSEIGNNADGGVLLQATGASFVEATLVENVFVWNGPSITTTGITADAGGAGGGADVTIARNVFHESQANRKLNGGAFTSGGGNVLGPLAGYTAASATFSF